MSQVVKVENAHPLEARSESNNMIPMLERVLADHTIPVERLERLIELHNAERQRQAKAEWSRCMSAAQSEMKSVFKNKQNSQTSSTYASYDAINEVAQPIYTKHGFSVTYDTEDLGRPDAVRILAFVENSEYERVFHVDMPCDGKGAKGNDVMTKTHAVKSAITYGKGALLPMIFNISVSDKADDDGNGACNRNATITDDQVTDLRDLLFSTGANLENFLKAAKVGDLSDILSKNYVALCQAVRQRARNRNGGSDAA